MYQRIGEKVNVAGVYMNGRFWPKKFLWQRRQFVITHVHSVHDWKDGSVRKRKFSLTAQTPERHNSHVYALEFDRDSETWLLDQIWVEEGV